MKRFRRKVTQARYVTTLTEVEAENEEAACRSFDNGGGQCIEIEVGDSVGFLDQSTEETYEVPE